MDQNGAEQELKVLRRTLDSLNSMRLSGALSEEASEVYDALCAREAQLLHELPRSA